MLFFPQIKGIQIQYFGMRECKHFHLSVQQSVVVLYTSRDVWNVYFPNDIKVSGNKWRSFFNLYFSAIPLGTRWERTMELVVFF